MGKPIDSADLLDLVFSELNEDSDCISFTAQEKEIRGRILQYVCRAIGRTPTMQTDIQMMTIINNGVAKVEDTGTGKYKVEIPELCAKALGINQGDSIAFSPVQCGPFVAVVLRNLDNEKRLIDHTISNAETNEQGKASDGLMLDLAKAFRKVSYFENRGKNEKS